MAIKNIRYRTLIWQRLIGGTGNDSNNGLFVYADGNILVSGNTNSSDFDITGNHGGYDFWLVKLNSSGDIIWQKTFGGTANDYCDDIKVLETGDIILAGYSSSVDGDVTGNYGSADTWIVRLNGSGSLLWQKNYGGLAADPAARIITETDGFVIAAYTNSANGDVPSNQGLADYWIFKIDADGNIEWSRTFGGSNDDYTQDLVKTADGGYLLAGFSSSNDGDVSGNHGATDYWIVKLSAFQGFTWTGAVSSDWNDIGNWSSGVIPTAVDDVIIPSGTSFSLVIDNGITVSCKRMRVKPAAQVTVKPGSGLKILN